MFYSHSVWLICITKFLFQSNLGGSNSSLSDAAGRAFASSFSAQSANAPSFHHSGEQLLNTWQLHLLIYILYKVDTKNLNSENHKKLNFWDELDPSTTCSNVCKGSSVQFLPPIFIFLLISSQFGITWIQKSNWLGLELHKFWFMLKPCKLPQFQDWTASSLLELDSLLAFFAHLMIDLYSQEACKGYIITCKETFFQPYQGHFHQGIPLWLLFLQVVSNNLGLASLLDDFHQTMFQLLCLK